MVSGAISIIGGSYAPIIDVGRPATDALSGFDRFGTFSDRAGPEKVCSVGEGVCRVGDRGGPKADINDKTNEVIAHTPASGPLLHTPRAIHL
jgi:hypothetical protein